MFSGNIGAGKNLKKGKQDKGLMKITESDLGWSD